MKSLFLALSLIFCSFLNVFAAFKAPVTVVAEVQCDNIQEWIEQVYKTDLQMLTSLCNGQAPEFEVTGARQGRLVLRGIDVDKIWFLDAEDSALHNAKNSLNASYTFQLP